MVDSLDFAELEKLTNKQKIDSHNSQLTNLRIHEIEMSLDQWRVQMLRDPTHENIIGCFAVISSWFSYVQSIEQAKRKKGTQDLFIEQIDSIRSKLNTMTQYVAFVQKQMVSVEIKKLYQELGEAKNTRKFWNRLEHDMVTLINEIIDDMRTIYQSMNFYFRTSKDNSAIGGILGDLVNAKKNKGVPAEIPTNESELEGTPE